MAELTLKSCSFCGGKAIADEYKDAHENWRFAIMCSDCPAEMGWFIEEQSPDAILAKRSETEAAWNRRAQDERVKALVEALDGARGTIRIASRILTDEHRLALKGKRWGDMALRRIDAALAQAQEQPHG